MVRPNIYDRLSQRREADEARAHEKAEQEAIEAAALKALLETPAVLPLQPEQNALKIAGLNVLMPSGLTFRNIETTLEVQGCEVAFTARRRPAPEDLGLHQAVEIYLKKLRQHHTELAMVRQAECLLAGHPAICLDYNHACGNECRHGRAVCAIIVSESDGSRQWLDISTAIDPDQPQLADWLVTFDAMLAGMTAD